jgi:8-oxo-dGTP pyrophosphatase MutT (NUDIX family)
LVSGMIEEGEQSLEAAKRELAEEAGLTASFWEQVGAFNMGSSIIEWPLYYFVAKNLQETVKHPDPSEEIEIVKVPLEEAVNNIFNGKIIKQSTITGILLVDAIFKRRG